MHTARLLTVSPSLYCSGGGSACSRGVSAPGGWLLVGVCWGWWYSSMHWGRPPSCGQNSWHMLPKKNYPAPNFVCRRQLESTSVDCQLPTFQPVLGNFKHVWGGGDVSDEYLYGEQTDREDKNIIFQQLYWPVVIKEATLNRKADPDELM